MLGVNARRMAGAAAGAILLTPLCAAIAFADPQADASVAPAERVVNVMAAPQDSGHERGMDPALPAAGGVLAAGAAIACAAGVFIVRKR